MGTMLENLIETINKDFLELSNIDEPKLLRKETSLLKQRIDSAQKLAANDQKLMTALESIKNKLKN